MSITDSLGGIASESDFLNCNAFSVSSNDYGLSIAKANYDALEVAPDTYTINFVVKPTGIGDESVSSSYDVTFTLSDPCESEDISGPGDGVSPIEYFVGDAALTVSFGSDFGGQFSSSPNSAFCTYQFSDTTVSGSTTS